MKPSAHPATSHVDGWLLYCDAFRSMFNRGPGQHEDVSVAAIQVMVSDLIEKLSVPSETPQKPVDPESEAANPVWDLVIAKCHSAYPEREGMQWGESPLELITEIINERDEARAALYEIKHVAYHFLESGEERVSDSEVAFDLPNEDYDKLVALLGDAHPEPGSSALSATRPSFEGRDFYELCQQYRHARHDPVAEYAAIIRYIKTGKLPWPSYEEKTDG